MGRYVRVLRTSEGGEFEWWEDRVHFPHLKNGDVFQIAEDEEFERIVINEKGGVFWKATSDAYLAQPTVGAGGLSWHASPTWTIDAEATDEVGMSLTYAHRMILRRLLARVKDSMFDDVALDKLRARVGE